MALPARSRPDLPPEQLASLVALIRKIAYRMARRLPSHVSVDDLIGAGQVGLMEALSRYEPSLCDRLEGYAEYRIKGAMLDMIRASDPVSRDARMNARKLVRVLAELRRELGREPEEDEIARALSMTLDAYHALLGQLARRGVVSLDSWGDDDRSVPVADTRPDPADRAARTQLVERLADAIETLPARLQTVLSLYYFEDCTLREIGEVMGFTESRACQLHSEAILRLRSRLATEGS